MPTNRRRRVRGRRSTDLDAIVDAFLEGRPPPAHIPSDEAFLQLRFWKNSDEGRRVLAELEAKKRGRRRPAKTSLGRPHGGNGLAPGVQG